MERFGDFSEAYYEYQAAEIVIVPVPFDLTTSYQSGAALGPEAFMKASKYLELYDIETDQEINLRGIYTAPPIQEASSEKMLSTLYEKVVSYLREGKFVATIGGEHSISPAPVRAHAELYGDISVLQFDAHTDLRQEYQGSKYSHACAMSRIREIPGVVSTTSVGIRSTSLEEQPFIDRKKTFYAYDTYRNNDWMQRAIDTLTDHVYITFDVDVFDPAVMPATGTPEPGGLFWPEIMQFLQKITEQKKVVGFDIVELMPISCLKAPDFMTVKLFYKMLNYIFNNKK